MHKVATFRTLFIKAGWYLEIWHKWRIPVVNAIQGTTYNCVRWLPEPSSCKMVLCTACIACFFAPASPAQCIEQWHWIIQNLNGRCLASSWQWLQDFRWAMRAWAPRCAQDCAMCWLWIPGGSKATGMTCEANSMYWAKVQWCMLAFVGPMFCPVLRWFELVWCFLICFLILRS